MLNSIIFTNVYKSLKLERFKSQAYLLYSSDKKLNNEIALNFAKSLICSTHNNCNKCHNCKQFISNSHPDITIIEQDSIKVEDEKKLFEKFSTKPITATYKIFVILNAETINEQAQNKLLKSIEEPSENIIFIFTSSETNKILPTILSRLTKILIPKLHFEDKLKIADELKKLSIDISKYMTYDINLTEIYNLELNKDYRDALAQIAYLFTNLHSTQDIPKLSFETKPVNKILFFYLMQDLFKSICEGNKKYPDSLISNISNAYNSKTITKIMPLINEAYKKIISNVNFSYVLDNLLFEILKEKYLCK